VRDQRATDQGDAEHTLDMRPPCLRIAQLRMRDLRLVPGEAVGRERPEVVPRDAMVGFVLVEDFDQASAPSPLPIRERAVEIPKDHPIHVPHERAVRSRT
jgi:hypothetical protein